MTENTPKTTGSESAAEPQGQFPKGHPVDVGTEPVLRGNEAANFEKRIITGEAKE